MDKSKTLIIEKEVLDYKLIIYTLFEISIASFIFLIPSFLFYAFYFLPIYAYCMTYIYVVGLLTAVKFYDNIDEFKKVKKEKCKVINNQP